jgi:hypothetical protein
MYQKGFHIIGIVVSKIQKIGKADLKVAIAQYRLQALGIRSRAA